MHKRQLPKEEKSIVVSNMTTDGRFVLFSELDEPYDEKKREWFKKFSEKNELPLIIVESSPGRFHIISFNLYKDPLKVARLQLSIKAKFISCDYPDLITALVKYKLVSANTLRIGYKDGERPRKLLDSFIVETDVPASESHLNLYRLLLFSDIRLEQPTEPTGICFYETNYTNIQVLK